MEVKWLNTALRNLDMEAEYISKENPEAAINVVQRIHNAVVLKDNPQELHKHQKRLECQFLLNTKQHRNQ